ncbi:uncharacterized protein [Oncorhynchus clarkii lewisi]|uniref:uncharacterized protein n=1 Tax=Oncorhynchus clarkii lewisi TaxID=490388 RepID=UPI0039B89304
MQNESWLLDMIKFLITPLMCIALYLLCCRRKWPCTQEEESDDSSVYVIPMHEEERTEGRREEASPPSRPPRRSRAPTPPPLPTTVYRPPYRELPPYSSVDLINPAPPYTPFDPKDPEDVPPSYRAVIEDIPPIYSAVVVSDDLPSVWYPPLPPVSPPLLPSPGYAQLPLPRP